MEVSEAAAAAGVVVRATSAAGDKLKLLRFEPDAARHERGLALLASEDSAPATAAGALPGGQKKAGRKDKSTVAAFFFLHHDTYSLPPPNMMQARL